MDHQKVQRAFSADDDETTTIFRRRHVIRSRNLPMLRLLRDVIMAPGASRCG